MQRVHETLFRRGILGPGGALLPLILLAAPMKRVARAQLKKVYVLNELGDMAGEYVLDPECPIDYNDFLKVLPDEGIGDRDTLFVGEYVFTTFTSGKSVFVLLSRGRLSPEDLEWTGTLLSAAESHLATASPVVPHATEVARPSGEIEAELSERKATLDAREKDLARLEVQLQADEANLKGRSDELARQKAGLASLADYVAQMQGQVASGVARAEASLAKAAETNASAEARGTIENQEALTELRRQFDAERDAVARSKQDLEARYREATNRITELEKQTANLESQRAQAVATLEKERADNAAREAEAEKLRAAIESRVQDLSLRFAAMAKERLVNSHRPSEAPGAAATGTSQDLDSARAELAKERKFLQRKAIETLDREELVRARETSVGDREAALAKKEAELAAREKVIESEKAAVPAVPPTSVEAAAAKSDIELRIKIIQQKALELLDREEKLRKRAAELQALESRLSGNIPT